MIEVVEHNNETLAIIIRREYSVDGIQFFTPDDYSQQIGFMKRPAGYEIPPHIHNEVPRAITMTCEALFIRHGAVRVDFYNDDCEYLTSRCLYEKDVILLIRGGHGFQMLSDSEIIEVKQGPYVGGADKVRFEP